jgi:hypothetical protein
MAESPETPLAEVLIDVDDWEPPALASRFKAAILLAIGNACLEAVCRLQTLCH